MLVIDQRRAVERFPGLEHLRRADVAQRERLEREHRDQVEVRRAECLVQRRHQPVLGFDFVEVRELAPLIVVAGKRGTFDRPLPRRGRVVVLMRRRLILRDRRTHTYREGQHDRPDKPHHLMIMRPENAGTPSAVWS
jgi:hypothetical protein